MMKRVQTKKSLLCFLLLLTFTLLSCGSSSKENKEKTLRQLAYNYMDDIAKTTILDWESAPVEVVSIEEQSSLFIPIEDIDLNGATAYKVTFTTDQDGLLGPIGVYLDQTSHKVIGYDLRE